MLPEVLSNGLCSLNPKVDRLCMVADIKLSRVGKVTGYEFYPAVMHSQARLTYNQVNAYFDDPTNETLPDDLVKNPAVCKSVDTLYQLYQILDKSVPSVVQWRLRLPKATSSLAKMATSRTSKTHSWRCSQTH